MRYLSTVMAKRNGTNQLFRKQTRYLSTVMAKRKGTNQLFRKQTHSAQSAKKPKKFHFGRTMHCLPQRLKSTFFEIFSKGAFPEGLEE